MYPGYKYHGLFTTGDGHVACSLLKAAAEANGPFLGAASVMRSFSPLNWLHNILSQLLQHFNVSGNAHIPSQVTATCLPQLLASTSMLMHFATFLGLEVVLNQPS